MGAPPGYVGYEEGGQLTEAVRWAGWLAGWLAGLPAVLDWMWGGGEVLLAVRRARQANSSSRVGWDTAAELLAHPTPSSQAAALRGGAV